MAGAVVRGLLFGRPRDVATAVEAGTDNIGINNGREACREKYDCPYKGQKTKQELEPYRRSLF